MIPSKAVVARGGNSATTRAAGQLSNHRYFSNDDDYLSSDIQYPQPLLAGTPCSPHPSPPLSPYA